MALYVHWPWCLSRCPYCDFNAYAAEAGALDQRRWRLAYLKELAHVAGETGPRVLSSIFFGGGTPSLMDPATVAAVIEAACRHWPPDAGLEVTLEANPSSVEAGRFRALHAAGVNRLSLGVQSFDADALKFLGRAHSVDDARRALAIAAATFQRFSFDLIYARPGQTEAAWRAELDEALAWRSEHLSLYQLTIERGTPFHKDKVPEAGEDDALALYQATQELATAAGHEAYEVSNHARRGARCRHNLAVWQGADYAGIGPGAHGRLTLGGRTFATRRMPRPDAWLAGVETAGHGGAGRTALDARARAEELVLLGLRLSAGVARARFQALTGADIEDVVDRAALARLIDAGLIEADAEALRATPAGRTRLNAVTAALLA